MLHTDLIAPIPELLRRHAAARGDKIAYRDAQTSVTYAALLDRTGKMIDDCAAAKCPSVISFIGYKWTNPDDPKSPAITREDAFTNSVARRTFWHNG